MAQSTEEPQDARIINNELIECAIIILQVNATMNAENKIFGVPEIKAKYEAKLSFIFGINLFSYVQIIVK